MALPVFLLASFVFIADRFTKAVVIANLSQGQSINILPGIFHITLVLNKGIAFGLLKGMGLLFVMVSLLVSAVIVVYTMKIRGRGTVTSLSLGLILGGAVGNLIDRVKFGYVIDFLDFRIWPVFNVADSCITIGTIILAYSILTQSAKRKA